MQEITFKTSKSKEVLDITERINNWLQDQKADNGLCNIFITHTTCCLTFADLDPGTDMDLLDALEKMFPKGIYRHPHDPSHIGEHIMSSIIGPSITLPVEKGKLVLGTWQRVVLVELSGPRTRNSVFNFITC